MHYYTSAVKLDKCAGICNTCNDVSNRVCVRNKTEDLNVRISIWLQEKLNQKF